MWKVKYQNKSIIKQAAFHCPYFDRDMMNNLSFRDELELDMLGGIERAGAKLQGRDPSVKEEKHLKGIE